MSRIRNLFHWAGCVVCGGLTLALIMVVAFWDTVVMGRPMDEQLDREDA